MTCAEWIHAGTDEISRIWKYWSCGFDRAGILKDVPDFPLVMIYNKEKDIKRLTLFPSLDYKGLHTVLVQLIEVISMIQTGIEGTASITATLTGWMRPNRWLFQLFSSLRDGCHEMQRSEKLGSARSYAWCRFWSRISSIMSPVWWLRQLHICRRWCIRTSSASSATSSCPSPWVIQTTFPSYQQLHESCKPCPVMFNWKMFCLKVLNRTKVLPWSKLPSPAS